MWVQWVEKEKTSKLSSCTLTLPWTESCRKVHLCCAWLGWNKLHSDLKRDYECITSQLNGLCDMSLQANYLICFFFRLILFEFLEELSPIFYVRINIKTNTKKDDKSLTIGRLYKPSTWEVAIVNVEGESPTIPSTGGVPTHFSGRTNCSSEPPASDNEPLNPTTSAPQLSRKLYPRVRFGSRVDFLLISSIAKAMVIECLNPKMSKLRHKMSPFSIKINHRFKRTAITWKHIFKTQFSTAKLLDMNTSTSLNVIIAQLHFSNRAQWWLWHLPSADWKLWLRCVSPFWKDWAIMHLKQPAHNNITGLMHFIKIELFP